MSLIFFFFLIGAIIVGLLTGRLKEVTDTSFQSAKDAVNLSINLIGIMALWLGLMRILEAGGAMQTIASKLKPLMRRLFPGVPAEHPAMSAMILNISANMLGLGNAATPFGIRAMTELNKLNPLPGVATNAMCLFLAINTSSVTLLPLGVIGVRAAAGASEPAAIFFTTLFATTCSTLSAVLAAFYFAKRDKVYLQEAISAPPPDLKNESQGTNSLEPENPYQHLLAASSGAEKGITRAIILLLLATILLRVLLGKLTVEELASEIATLWLMPGLMLAIVLYGYARGVKLYDAVTDGAKQGFDTAVRIIPFLVIILVAIGMFRSSGAMEYLGVLLSPFTDLIGMPAEVLPMALVRPLSGSGAFALMSEIIQRDPNSYAAFLASTIQGSTETTFYVLAVYFGSCGILRFRHAVWCGLIADVFGVLGACIICSVTY